MEFKTPVHITEPGDYEITTVVNVSIAKVSTPALALDAGPDKSAVVGETIPFTASVSGGVSPYTVSWEWGDGTPTTDGLVVTHIYSTAGSYSVTATARDSTVPSLSISDTAAITVAVPAPPPTGDWIDTGHDRIPTPASRATLTAIHSGFASDPSVYIQNRVPVANDIIIVDRSTLTWDIDNLPVQIVVYSGGTLTTKQVNQKLLIAGQLLVYEGGTLDWRATGTAKPEIVFADIPLPSFDVEQYGNSLIVLGKILTDGPARTPFVRLSNPVSVGDTTLRLVSPVTGWQVGDKLCFGGDSIETLTVSSVSSDGLTVTLSTGTVGSHGADSEGRLPFIGNLTRNVVIRSANASGVRGHVMLTWNGIQEVRNTEFRGLGRTTYELPSPTNQTGRYGGPHVHHKTGGSFVIDGCSSWCPMTSHPYKWGMVIHDSRDGIASNNIMYNWAGSGFYVEDYESSGNLIEKNFVCSSRGRPGADRFDWGMKGEAFAFRSADNIIRFNVACNGDDRGYSFYATGPAKEFHDNECYYQRAAFASWNVNAAGQPTPNPSAPQSIIGKLIGWNLNEWGVGLGYPSLNLTFDNLILRGTWVANSYGFQYGDYDTRNFIVQNSDIRFFRTGVEVPLKVNDQTIYEPGTFELKDTFIDCEFAVWSATPSGPGTGGAVGCRPRKAAIRNVTYGTSSLGYKIVRQAETFSQCNLLVKDEMYVYAHDGDPTLNFRVYYPQQAANALMPKSSAFGGFGAPELATNFTNQYLYDNWEWRLSLDPFDLQYRRVGTVGPSSTKWVSYSPVTNPQGWERVCWAGEIAPADAEDGSPWGVYGLVKRF